MHLILTGATGLIGAGVLDAMLSTAAVSKISILSRRPVPMAEGQAKAHVIIHKDFLKYDSELLDKLKGAHGCVWALGISQTAVSQEDYIKITKDFPLAAAQAFASLSPEFNFVFVSGGGARQTPGPFTSLYGRIKGETEVALLAMNKTNPNFRVYSPRPGMVDPQEHTEIHQFIPQNPTATLRRFVGPVIRATWKNLVSPTKPLGKVMTELAMGDGKPLEGSGVEGEGRIISNVRLRAMGGL